MSKPFTAKCSYCGREMMAKNKKRRFCKATCRVEWNRRKKKALLDKALIGTVPTAPKVMKSGELMSLSDGLREGREHFMVILRDNGKTGDARTVAWMDKIETWVRSSYSLQKFVESFL